MRKLWLCIPPEGLFKHPGHLQCRINKDQPNEKSKGYLVRAWDSKGVGHITSLLAQRQAEAWESFIAKREGFGCT